MPAWRRLLLFAGLVLAPLATPAVAQGPVTLVVGFAAGGPTDLLGRMLAERMAPLLGQPVAVTNLAGSGGARGADLVARSAADGRAIGLVSAAHAVVPGLLARLPYHPIEDFTPIAFVGDGASILVVTPGLPARSLAELVALGRGGAAPLVLGAVGPAGFQTAAEMLRVETGLVFESVPYRSGALAALAVMEGRAQMMFASPVDAVGPVTDGRLRALGATSPTRAALLPQVPTFREAGFPDFHSDSWFGLLAPRGMPAPIADRLHGVIGQVLADPAAQAAMRRLGVESRAMPRSEWAAFLRRETARWTAAARASGARME